MKLLWLGLAVLASCLLSLNAQAQGQRYYLIASGLGGETQYEELFSEQLQRLQTLAKDYAGEAARIITLDAEQNTAARLRQSFAELSRTLTAQDELVVILLGHGSYDGQDYKFNIKGPDLTGRQLGELLDSVKARRQIVINATSSSGAIAESLAAENRIVITATKSGGERNATRFARFWIEAHSAPEADLNKNELLSLQEIFDYAARQIAGYYQSRGQLATEHPQLLGDGAQQINLARVGNIAKAYDSAGANTELQRLLQQRTELEQNIEQLRARRQELPQDEYLDNLQQLLVELSLLQLRIDAELPEQEP